MEEYIEKLRLIDDEIFEVVQEVSHLIPNLFNSKESDKINELLFMYFNSTNFIKNSIFDCSINEDIYSVKILFRSLLEHFIRFKYIFINYISNNVSFDSKKYFTMQDASEHLDYIKSINRCNKMYWVLDFSLDDIWKELLTLVPEIKEYTRKEVEENAKNHSIKNLINFLENEINKNINLDNDFLRNIILKYSELSSYVHGWIFAYKSNFKYSSEKTRFEELVKISTLALQVSSSVKLFSFLLFSKYDDKFKNSYLKIQKLVNKIN